MADTRNRRAKLNIIISRVYQVVVIICGLITPRLLLGAFGSAKNGAVNSIANFLTYITLLEGGIGGVARAALYKPLAENNMQRVAEIISEIKHFFRIVGFIFIGYVAALAVFFRDIAGMQNEDWAITAILVVIISFATFAQYFIGISYAVFLNAAQKTYIASIISIGATVLNTILIVLMLGVFKLGGSYVDLIIVKFVSSLIFVAKPVLMWLYVQKKYKIPHLPYRKGQNYLSQKWTGLGQHIAYSLNSHTDVAVLTIFAGSNDPAMNQLNLIFVSIYTVFNMVISHIRNFAGSFASGMEALFGEMLAKKEFKTLHRTFSYYETLLSAISIFMFGVTAVMVVPFIKLYTSNIKVAAEHELYYNSGAALFGILLILATLVTVLRSPYHNLVIAAGHFKQTKWAAYGEAILNISLSILLVIVLDNKLIGVAIGTLAAQSLRFLYYVFYLSKHIFNRNILLFVKREAVNAAAFLSICFGGDFLLNVLKPILPADDSWIHWILCAVIVSVGAFVIDLVLNLIFYKNDLDAILHKIIRRKEKPAAPKEA